MDPDDVFTFVESTEDLARIPAPVVGHPAISDQGTQTPHSIDPSSVITSNAVRRPSQEGLGLVENVDLTPQSVSRGTTGGRPPMAPWPPVCHEVGQYQQGHGRVGGRGGTGGTRGRGRTEGQQIGGASSSRPTNCPLLGIGARDPHRVVEPFLSTYVPGPNGSTRHLLFQQLQFQVGPL